MANSHHEPRRHFSKTMFNPYFQTHHYANETNASKMERSIENKFLSLKTFIKKIIKQK